MSFRGEQKVKGKIYVYEATAIWNAQKQRSEQKRIYIGTKDPETGKFIPNKKYYQLHGDETPEQKNDTLPPPVKVLTSPCIWEYQCDAACCRYHRSFRIL